MKYVFNKFGEGIMYTPDDFMRKDIYVACTACMSVMSDMASFIYAEGDVMYSFVDDVKLADVIIVLGCQVTDLAILNDIRTAEELALQNDKAEVYIGGCLAYRFDIKLPTNIGRVATFRTVGAYVDEDAIALTHWRKPFWVPSFDDKDGELEQGHIFRDMYPLKIGAGCHGRCAYCTINVTRGESYEMSANDRVKEFLEHEDVVLISDSPTAQQIKDWCEISEKYRKPFSIRNVEPATAVQCKAELLRAADLGLLRIFHCPIQSADEELLRIMHRDPKSTMEYISMAKELRSYGTIVATNIIIDYVGPNGKVYRNMDEEWLNDNFSYWSWNPYFDGDYSTEKAEERFKKYIG